MLKTRKSQFFHLWFSCMAESRIIIVLYKYTKLSQIMQYEYFKIFAWMYNIFYTNVTCVARSRISGVRSDALTTSIGPFRLSESSHGFKSAKPTHVIISPFFFQSSCCRLLQRQCCSSVVLRECKIIVEQGIDAPSSIFPSGMVLLIVLIGRMISIWAREWRARWARRAAFSRWRLSSCIRFEIILFNRFGSVTFIAYKAVTKIAAMLQKWYMLKIWYSDTNAESIQEIHLNMCIVTSKTLAVME